MNHKQRVSSACLLYSRSELIKKRNAAQKRMQYLENQFPNLTETELLELDDVSQRYLTFRDASRVTKSHR